MFPFFKRPNYIVLVFSLFILFCPMLSFAGGSGNHPHKDESSNMNQAGHEHESWPEPPVPYTGKRLSNWKDQSEINKGKIIYEEDCLDCHGKNGRGTGPIAKELDHPPADLTTHFHCNSGQGDDYLFWRVSEGGEVAPFITTNSAMPSFKDIYSEKERWAVLIYIHAIFHAKDSEICDKGKKDH